MTGVNETSVSLRWDEPSDDGGAPITNYIIGKRETSRRSYQQAGKTEEGEFTVDLLIEGTNYVFQVAAENECGVGQAVELKQAVTAKSPYGM